MRLERGERSEWRRGEMNEKKTTLKPSRLTKHLYNDGEGVKVQRATEKRSAEQKLKFVQGCRRNRLDRGYIRPAGKANHQQRNVAA